jgi:hypothetical protein
MFWYWVGAVLSYFFSVLTLILVFIHRLIDRKSIEKANVIILFAQVIGVIACFVDILWTTFIIIAWQSGM